jgi:5-methylcytosine-specific restriction enzyme B
MVPTFDESIIKDIREHLWRCEQEGELLSKTKLQNYQSTFQEKFGPDVLNGLDGENLLNVMHERQTGHNSLAYWLEFKDDEEFPTSKFGGIAGGSAMKFNLYQRASDGAMDDWTSKG